MLSVFMGALFGEHRIWLINFVRTFSVIAFSVAAYLALEWGHGWFVIGVIHLVVYGLEYLCFRRSGKAHPALDPPAAQHV